jgi:hypothetical protein
MKRFFLAIAALVTSAACLAGTWGSGSFENDDALDWVQQCAESKSPGVVASALQAALKPGAIDATEGAIAVAAAEVVAASKGKPSKALPQALREWLSGQPKEEVSALAPIARKALMKVKEPKSSELGQLWSESKDKQWASLIDELQTRLQ